MFCVRLTTPTQGTVLIACYFSDCPHKKIELTSKIEMGLIIEANVHVTNLKLNWADMNVGNKEKKIKNYSIKKSP